MIEFKEKENGFEYIEVKNSAASAKIALQGAHIFSYKRHGEEDILWLSEVSEFELGKSIRGGIPICWPSFGMNNPDLPQHGFARVAMWKLDNAVDTDSSTTTLTFRYKYSTKTLQLWKYKFDLEFKVTISDKLTMELTTNNLDSKAFKLTQAFHSYFNISDISNIKIHGLDKKPYFDALTSTKKQQNGDILFDKEFDSVYQEVDGEMILIDKDRQISVLNQGSSSVVIWNPWIEKCKKMSAMINKAYKKFACIESANAFDDFKILNANESHTLKAIIF